MNTYAKSLSSRRKYVIDMPTLGLCLFVGLSFFLRLFARAFSGYAYVFLLFVFTMICVLSKGIAFRRGGKFVKMWSLPVVVIVFSFLRSQMSNAALLDIIVFVCGFLLLLSFSDKEIVYLRCLKVIKALAIFFAVGILLQRFLPPLYRIIIATFPSAYRAALTAREASGFTLNPGYSAGYIIAGLFVALSERSIKGGYTLTPIFLFLVLLMTGKRGPILFLIMSIIYTYLSPVGGFKKIGRFWKIFLVVLFVVLLLWLFRDSFSSIPIIKRTFESVAKASSGEDITSGRMSLYLWAISLFNRNRVFGIGWGRYKTTVIGNVTVAKDLETHNIYLQLLAESGLIGFVIFAAMFFLFWNTARIAYRRCIREGGANALHWRKLLFFSVSYQTFFLLYGMTGNPLYDQHFQIMYVFSCLIITAFKSIEDSIYKNS